MDSSRMEGGKYIKEIYKVKGLDVHPECYVIILL